MGSVGVQGFDLHNLKDLDLTISTRGIIRNDLNTMMEALRVHYPFMVHDRKLYLSGLNCRFVDQFIFKKKDEKTARHVDKYLSYQTRTAITSASLAAISLLYNSNLVYKAPGSIGEINVHCYEEEDNIIVDVEHYPGTFSVLASVSDIYTAVEDEIFKINQLGVFNGLDINTEDVMPYINILGGRATVLNLAVKLTGERYKKLKDFLKVSCSEKCKDLFSYDSYLLEDNKLAVSFPLSQLNEITIRKIL